MKASEDVINKALPWEEDEDGLLKCPHCHKILQKYYDGCNLETFGDTGIHVRKDPYFCECSSSTTVYWKCPKCNKPIEEHIDWDN